MLTQVERISKKIILAAGLRPELTFTSFGRHGGTTEASTSGLTETQLMKKGHGHRPKRWRTTSIMTTRPSRTHRSNASSGASKRPESEHLSEWIRRSCRNENQEIR